MSLKEHRFIGEYIVKLLQRKTSMLLIAFMLGMSNVILEEDRMVNDTQEQIEQQVIANEDNPQDTVFYSDAF